jgi:hypothetical protein
MIQTRKHLWILEKQLVYRGQDEKQQVSYCLNKNLIDFILIDQTLISHDLDLEASL